MALFENLTDEVQPYVLKKQRDESFKGVQSVFYLAPMNAREFQRFSDRREAANRERRLSVDKQAEKVSDLDEEALRSKLKKALNIFKDGDVIEGADAIGELVRKFDWNEVQELIVAAANRSILEDGAKNS